MLKGRESNKGHGGAPPADLLVCFPTRTRLSLMPKPSSSPSRPNSEPNKRFSHNHHLKRINTRAGCSSGAGAGPGSPLIWAKDNQIRGGGPEMSEPTSPKVTCAGQIKVRHRSSNGCRNWMTVMEEIERIHNRTKRKSKKSSWGETFGFKKDVMSFLTCLRNLKFDFRCFGSFPEQILSSDEEEEDDDDEMEVDENSRKVGDAVALIKGKGKTLRRKEKRARIEQIRASLGLSDSLRTPAPGETLRDFYKRTSTYWQMAAYEHTQHTGKELRKDGFDFAEVRYRELKPLLDELAILEEEQKAEEQQVGESSARKGGNKKNRHSSSKR